MILFERGTQPGVKNQLVSYDRNFSFTRATIDPAAFGIQDFFDFACLPELNVFITLNSDSSAPGPGPSSPKEVVIYRGGRATNALTRVLFRIYNLPSDAVNMQTYI